MFRPLRGSRGRPDEVLRDLGIIILGAKNREVDKDGDPEMASDVQQMPTARISVVLCVVALAAIAAGGTGSHKQHDLSKPNAHLRDEIINTLAASPPSDAASFGKMAHGFLAVIHGALLLYCLLLGSSADRPAAFRRAAAALSAIFVLEACAHSLSPMPHLSVGVMIFVSVVFTIGPIEDEERPLGLLLVDQRLVDQLLVGHTKQDNIGKTIF